MSQYGNLLAIRRIVRQYTRICGGAMKQEDYVVQIKTVILPNKKTIEFPVKICRPQVSIEQQMYSLCHARCVGSTRKFRGVQG
jgi:hypothetical protein